MHERIIQPTEVYELCCVIRAYFPAVEIEICIFLLSSTFHCTFIFWGTMKSTSCCWTPPKGLVLVPCIVRFTAAVRSARVSSPPPHGTVQFVRLVQTVIKASSYCWWGFHKWLVNASGGEKERWTLWDRRFFLELGICSHYQRACRDRPSFTVLRPHDPVSLALCFCCPSCRLPWACLFKIRWARPQAAPPSSCMNLLLHCSSLNTQCGRGVHTLSHGQATAFEGCCYQYLALLLAYFIYAILLLKFQAPWWGKMSCLEMGACV